jgi:hypothetical protein
MTKAENLEKSGNDAIRKLRLEKLRKGFPFMINSKELPSSQCYLEYPTGKITLVSLPEGSMDFILIRELTLQESSQIRQKFHLEIFNA